MMKIPSSPEVSTQIYQTTIMHCLGSLKAPRKTAENTEHSKYIRILLATILMIY